jgi:hypothetical protein
MLLQNIGGLVQATMLFFNFFLLPISETSFYLDISRKLYKAKVDDKTFFDNDNKVTDTKNKSTVFSSSSSVGSSNDEINKEIKAHKSIQLRLSDFWRLFFSRMCFCF